MHLIVLHETAGSGNPLGVSGNYERIPFAPYFIFKDLITIFIFIFVLSLFVFFMPNVLGDSENYVMANPMQTPAAIVPEWYLLPFYAILRSIPNKLLGVIAMFSAILILLLLPITDISRSRGIQFRPLSKIVFYVFIANFLILMQLGAKHVESPFIEFGQISTVLYFLYFILIMYSVTFFENSFIELKIAIPFRELNLNKYSNSVPKWFIIIVGILLVVILYSYIYTPVLCDSPDWNTIYENVNQTKPVSSLPTPGGSGEDSSGIVPQEYPVPGRRCPSCLERGDTVWVIPGKSCPICGTPVN